MAFDAHSRKRLEELGRTLPQALPKPETAKQEETQAAPLHRRHRLETETDPQALFHELMQASPDGSVPPHLLERLKELESQPPPRAHERDSQRPSPGQQPRLQRRQPAAERSQDPLYVSFEQMLLEDDSL